MSETTQFTLDPVTSASVTELAEEEGATPDEFVKGIVEAAIASHDEEKSPAAPASPPAFRGEEKHLGPRREALGAASETAPPAKPVTISEAKTQLSKLIVRVQSGETITIAHGNRPAAQLVPMPVMERTPGLFARRARGDDVSDALRFLRGEGREEEFAAADGGALSERIGLGAKAEA